MKTRWIPLVAALVAIRLGTAGTAQTVAAGQIQGGQPLVFDGGTICLCGSGFPVPPPQLLLDGQPVTGVGSQGRIDVTLASGLAPGQHTIASGNRSVSGSHTFELVVPVFTVTPAQLRRGGRGLLHLVVNGSRKPLPVLLRNETPNIITMDGGTEINVTTSGNAFNSEAPEIGLTGGPDLGPFRVQATIRGASCPCGSGTSTGGPGAGGDVVDPPPPTGVTPPVEQPTALGILLERREETWMPAPDLPPPSCPSSGTSQTTLRAQLYELHGGAWEQSATAEQPITIWFASRSREAGTALNAGLGGAPQIPDLYFDPAANPLFECPANSVPYPKYPALCRTRAPSNAAIITVTATDYGAFGDADASCPGCVRLERRRGVVVTATGATGSSPTEGPYEPGASRPSHLVTVPRDENHNGIADVWWHERADATEDVDETPSSHFSGDGMTAYEEYRGFVVKNCHVRTDPDVKDFFVHNPDGFDLSLFKNASGLMVWEILAAEWDGTSSRLVNYNRGYASIVDQHGIWLMDAPVPTLADWSIGPIDGYTGGTGTGGIFAFEGFGPPKNVTQVRIDRTKVVSARGLKPPLVSPPPAATPQHDATLDLLELVAHELGHASGMRHHGDGSVGVLDVWGLGPPTASSNGIAAPDDRVHYNLPTLLGRTLSPDRPTPFSAGHPGDKGSGDIFCIMVYPNFGDVVLDHASPGGICTAQTKRALPTTPGGTVPNNPFGATPYVTGGRDHYCSSPSGTGPNTGGRCHGDAVRGNCKAQIHISDAK